MRESQFVVLSFPRVLHLQLRRPPPPPPPLLPPREIKRGTHIWTFKNPNTLPVLPVRLIPPSQAYKSAPSDILAVVEVGS